MPLRPLIPARAIPPVLIVSALTGKQQCKMSGTVVFPAHPELRAVQRFAVSIADLLTGNLRVGIQLQTYRSGELGG